MRIEKQPNESWLVYTLPGLTQQEIKDKDDAVLSDDGLFIVHNDPKKTLTFIPRHAICSLRSWWPKGRVTDGSVRANVDQESAKLGGYASVGGLVSKELIMELVQGMAGSDSDADIVDAEVL